MEEKGVSMHRAVCTQEAINEGQLKELKSCTALVILVAAAHCVVGAVILVFATNKASQFATAPPIPLRKYQPLPSSPVILKNHTLALPANLIEFLHVVFFLLAFFLGEPSVREGDAGETGEGQGSIGGIHGCNRIKRATRSKKDQVKGYETR